MRKKSPRPYDDLALIDDINTASEVLSALAHYHIIGPNAVIGPEQLEAAARRIFAGRFPGSGWLAKDTPFLAAAKAIAFTEARVAFEAAGVTVADSTFTVAMDTEVEIAVRDENAGDETGDATLVIYGSITLHPGDTIHITRVRVEQLEATND